MLSLKWKKPTPHTLKTNPENKNQSQLHAWCSWVSHVCFVVETKEQCVYVYVRVCVYVYEDGFASEN